MDNPFAVLENDVFRLVQRDGTRTENLRSRGVQNGVVKFYRSDIDFQEGDMLERDLPHGRTEIYRIEDVQYQPGKLNAIPPSYTLKVRNVAKPEQPPVPGSVTYHLNGANSRVNHASTDQSFNLALSSHDDLFNNLQEALNNATASKEEFQALQNELAEMKAAQGQPGFLDHYVRFMALAADHLTVFTPFLPALAQLLTNAGQR